MPLDVPISGLDVPASSWFDARLDCCCCARNPPVRTSWTCPIGDAKHSQDWRGSQVPPVFVEGINKLWATADALDFPDYKNLLAELDFDSAAPDAVVGRLIAGPVGDFIDNSGLSVAQNAIYDPEHDQVLAVCRAGFQLSSGVSTGSWLQYHPSAEVYGTIDGFVDPRELHFDPITGLLDGIIVELSDGTVEFWAYTVTSVGGNSIVTLVDPHGVTQVDLTIPHFTTTTYYWFTSYLLFINPHTGKIEKAIRLGIRHGQDSPADSTGAGVFALGDCDRAALTYGPQNGFFEYKKIFLIDTAARKIIVTRTDVADIGSAQSLHYWCEKDLFITYLQDGARPSSFARFLFLDSETMATSRSFDLPGFTALTNRFIDWTVWVPSTQKIWAGEYDGGDPAHIHIIDPVSGEIEETIDSPGEINHWNNPIYNPVLDAVVVPVNSTDETNTFWKNGLLMFDAQTHALKCWTTKPVWGPGAPLFTSQEYPFFLAQRSNGTIYSLDFLGRIVEVKVP